MLNLKWQENTINKDILKGDVVLNLFSTKGRWKYKSNNKSLTAKALGMPVATNPDDLKKYMNEKERKKAAMEGIEEVKKFYDVRISVKEYQDLISKLKQKKNDSISLSK